MCIALAATAVGGCVRHAVSMAGDCAKPVDNGIPPPDTGSCTSEYASYRHINPVAYPPGALSAHVAGVVYIRTTIDTDGHASATALALAEPESAAVLADAAIAAIQSWRYNAKTHCGTPQQSTIMIPLRFAIDPDAPQVPLHRVEEGVDWLEAVIVKP